MASNDRTFPISELEDQVLSVTKNFKTKSRKLPKDFDLQRDCELFELTQYRCATHKELHQQTLDNPGTPPTNDCYPFSRLFRRCGQGASAFNVETTSWEGQLAWQPKRLLEEEVKPQKTWWSSFWSK
jgi:hypothetical protein